MPIAPLIHSWKHVSFEAYSIRGFAKSSNVKLSQPYMLWSCKKVLQNLNRHWNKQKERQEQI